MKSIPRLAKKTITKAKDSQVTEVQNGTKSPKRKRKRRRRSGFSRKSTPTRKDHPPDTEEISDMEGIRGTDEAVGDDKEKAAVPVVSNGHNDEISVDEKESQSKDSVKTLRFVAEFEVHQSFFDLSLLC